MNVYYRRYVTGLLLSAYIFNQMDRAVFNLLMEPIARDLRLSDTKLGFLAGPAFVLFYAVVGVAIASCADRFNRVNIISISVALWSVMATLTGFAANFWQLVAVRIGVGVGEAGCTPPAASILADYFPPQDRSLAISVYMLGIPLGAIVSDLVAGWVNQYYGWRAAFWVSAPAGVVLALVIKSTLREPVRTNSLANGLADQDTPGLGAVIGTIWRRKALAHLVAGLVVMNTVFASTSWFSVMFIRRYGMSTGELGGWLAITSGAGGGLGIWLGGFLSAKAKHQRRQTLVLMWSSLFSCPLLFAVLLAPSKTMALVALLPASVAVSMYLGPSFSIVQELCDARSRATVVAVVIFLQLMGGGLIGSQLIGILSDAIAVSSHGQGLLWLMEACCLGALWAAAHFWQSARITTGRDSASRLA